MIRVLTVEEGGRSKPFFDGYQPQFHFRTTNTTGVIRLGPDGMALPGDLVEADVELGKPIAVSEGLGFAVREGGRTVAAGTVTGLLA